MAEAAEPTMDCNLPELLAQDLEFSSLIFAAKNMTAGAPSPALASDEDDWHGTAEPRRSSAHHATRTACRSSNPWAPLTRRALPAGRASMTSPMTPRVQAATPLAWPATTSTERTTPPIRPDDRHHHIGFEPARGDGILAKTCRVLRGEVEGSFESWMDFEPDAPADHPELGKSLAQSPVTTPLKPVRPLSRLGGRSINESSPQRAKSANAAATTRRLSNPFEGYTRPASRARSLHLDPTTTTTTPAAAAAAAAKEPNWHPNHSLHSFHPVDIAVPRAAHP
ncbi:hypothetical protein Ct61P_14197 [Colletotrichum tofieldiae]|nr:hypothetical protein Ct61P_14197 [Colletotrichum tofieldiae]